MTIIVRKFDGTTQPFDESKLRNSLRRAGATTEIANRILIEVKKELFDGMSTKIIYNHAMRLYKKLEPRLAPHYGLKHALLRLGGKEGFTFEVFIEKLLNAQGYATRRDELVKGEILTHEIDVTARKGSDTIMVECKHHMNPWMTNHVQTILYVYARFLDVKKNYTNAMLVTNTKFSPPVVRYARAKKLKLLGWSYPDRGNMQDVIMQYQVYPVTMLPQLREEEERNLFERNIVTLSDFLQHTDDDLTRACGATLKRVQAMRTQAEHLMQYEHLENQAN